MLAAYLALAAVAITLRLLNLRHLERHGHEVPPELGDVIDAQRLESISDYTRLRGWLGLLGLVLALVGVYGVVSYSATQRSREIGIRMALGGTPAAIRAMFLRQGASFVVLGIAAGLVGAFGLTRILKRFLLLVSAVDPVTFVAVPLALAAVAIWACWVPARHATNVDPMLVLRQD